MLGLGTAVNVGAILLGGTLGLLGQRTLPERTTNTILQIMGLFTAVVGLRMLWPGQAMIFTLISLVIGGSIGEGLRIEERLQRASEWTLNRFRKASGSPAQGFLAASLLFCVGPLAILGSLADGVSRDYGILWTKSILDGIASVPLAASLGAGVMLSALAVLVYQGALTIGAAHLRFLQQAPILANLNTVGGFLVLAIGLSIAEIKRFRVANYLPALVVQVILSLLALAYPILEKLS